MQVQGASIQGLGSLADAIPNTVSADVSTMISVSQSTFGEEAWCALLLHGNLAPLDFHKPGIRALLVDLSCGR
jgi:hypothetical protein